MRKNFIIAAIAMMFVSLSTFAQGNANFEGMYARMASRLAKNMKLDDVSTEQFTTLYAEYMKVRMIASGMTEENRERVDLENITDEQIEYLINTIKDCVAKMRQSSPLWKEITNEDN